VDSRDNSSEPCNDYALVWIRVTAPHAFAILLPSVYSMKSWLSLANQFVLASKLIWLFRKDPDDRGISYALPIVQGMLRTELDSVREFYGTFLTLETFYSMLYRCGWISGFGGWRLHPKWSQRCWVHLYVAFVTFSREIVHDSKQCINREKQDILILGTRKGRNKPYLIHRAIFSPQKFPIVLSLLVYPVSKRWVFVISLWNKAVTVF